MSRALIIVSMLLCLGLLPGCGATPPQEPPPVIVVESSATSGIGQWLNRQEQVAGLSGGQVAAELEGWTRPEQGPELFEFGLLNHYAGQYEGWIQARDAFRKLSTDPGLSQEQRQLAALLETYNQQRINTYQRYLQLLEENDGLQQQVADAELKKARLQQQIQALTELEAQISTRKDQ